MPERPRRIPSYCRHKATGQAYVTISDREIYLGIYGSSESHEKYARLLAENFPNGNGNSHPPTLSPLCGEEITINELILRFWTEFVEDYHKKNGKPTERQWDVKRALRFLQQLYGSELARRFGPKALQTVRAKIIKTGLDSRCQRVEGWQRGGAYRLEPS